jgi:hypothetical protein
MLKNYFIIAWRNLTRNKLRAGIHILGLSIGISICFLIFNIIWFSNSFDKFHPDLEQIYRINTLTDYGPEGSYPNSGTPGPLGEVIQDELSGVELKGRLNTLYQVLVAVPDQNRVIGRSTAATFADPGFFKIFPRTWLAGNPETALVNPESVVLSQKSLNKYFPGTDPANALGLELIWVDADTIRAQVTGIVADYIDNTDLIFTDFISYSTIQTEKQKEWYGLHSWGNVNSSSQLFVKTVPGVTVEEMNKGFEKIVAKNYKADEDGKTSFFAESISEMHFGQNYDDTTVSKVFLNGLTYVGFGHFEFYQPGDCPSDRSGKGSRNQKNSGRKKTSAYFPVFDGNLFDCDPCYHIGAWIGGDSPKCFL